VIRQKFTFLWVLLGLVVGLSETAQAGFIFSKKNYPQVTVMRPPFIEMRTGPGRGFPIFYVVERGDRVEVIQRKTGWFKVRNAKNKTGWVSRQNMAQTLNAAGNALALQQLNLNDFEQRRWELGVQGGDFAGTPLVSGVLAYNYTQHLSLELSVNQASGQISNNLYTTLNMTHQPYPAWRLSPYVMIGLGRIHTRLNKTLIQSDDRDNEMVHAGGGLRAYITKRFIFRLEYRNYVVLTNQTENEENEEWKAGFGVFF
jgi:hypothetical protein